MNVLTALKLQRIFDADPSTTATTAIATPGFCATKILSNLDDRSSTPSFDPIAYIPGIKTAETGGAVLAYAAFFPSPPGTILLPYWIWDGASNCLSGVWRGAFYNFVQEMSMQWRSPPGHVYVGRLNPVAYDLSKQDSLWSWSETFLN